MIEIQQAIWGYASGHHLLSSSVSLSIQSIRVLEQLTDLSGSEIIKSFDGYLTGCYLPKDNCYAISKTWYAPEMPRQGCVWTHTLLIKDIFMPKLSDMNIEELFQKPDINNAAWKAQYCNPVILQPQMIDRISNESTIIISAAFRMFSIMMRHTEPIIIAAPDSKKFNQIIEFLINEVGMDFIKDITFCTGSFSNRTINRVQFDLQIVPESISKQVVRTSQSETYYVNDLLNLESDNDNQDCWNTQESYIEVKEFINFCDRKFFKRTYWTVFEKIYRSLKKLENFSVETTGNVLQSILDENQLSAVMLKVFEYIFCYSQERINDASKTKVKILFDFFTLNIFTMDIAALPTIQNAINYLWVQQRPQMLEQLPRLFTCELNEVGESALNSISSLVTLNDFAQLLQKNANMCLSMLHSNYKLALCADIWKQTRNYQAEVLRELRDIPEEYRYTEGLCFDIAVLVFGVGIYGLPTEMYAAFKDDSINAFIDYFESNNCNHANIKKWSPLCAMNQRLTLRKLETVNNSELFEAIISILDPYTIEISDLPPKVLEKYYRKFCCSNNCRSVTLEFSQFALPVVLRSNYSFSNEFLKFVFFTVHRLLADNEMENAKWEKLSNILPEVAWNNSWDKCKRLRKASKQKKYNIDFGTMEFE
ncbi:hypothetical protein [Oscillibacter sp.]|uniref:GAP1-N1 domain-containing protein n=1 Tax=Oscillibacter sp. TaxID=1945593 RepID=UPI0028AF5031|nr:hypothetical protein [Oscillibacter sp.]